MKNQHWKEVIRKNLHFNRLLKLIVEGAKVDKSKVKGELTIEAKFELIRMESFELLEFRDQNLTLGKRPYELIEFYSNAQLKAVG